MNKVGFPPRTPSPPQLGRGRGGEEEVGAPEWGRGGIFNVKTAPSACVRAWLLQLFLTQAAEKRRVSPSKKKLPKLNAERPEGGRRSHAGEKEAREFLARRRVAWRIELNNAVVITKKDLTLTALFFFPTTRASKQPASQPAYRLLASSKRRLDLTANANKTKQSTLRILYFISLHVFFLENENVVVPLVVFLCSA